MTRYIEERLWKAKMVRKNKLTLQTLLFYFQLRSVYKILIPKGWRKTILSQRRLSGSQNDFESWNSFLEERATMTSRRASPLFVGGEEATNDSYHLSILWNTVLKTITLGPHTWAFSALEFLFSLIISPMPPHFLPLEGGTLIGYPCTPVGWFCFCSLRLLQNSNVCPHLLEGVQCRIHGPLPAIPDVVKAKGMIPRVRRRQLASPSPVVPSLSATLGGGMIERRIADGH